MAGNTVPYFTVTALVPSSTSPSSIISAELICLSIYALRTDKLYFSSGPRVDGCIFEVQSTVPG